MEKEAKKKLSLRQKKFLKVYEGSLGNVAYACSQIKMSRNNYYLWKQNNEEFAKAVNEIDESTLDYAESKLMESIQEKNLTAIIFYLKTKGKKRGYVEEVDNNVTINAFEKLMRELPDD